MGYSRTVKISVEIEFISSHLNKLYYKNAVGVILVYDITQVDTYESL